jgi:hypothetical protein
MVILLSQSMTSCILLEMLIVLGLPDTVFLDLMGLALAKDGVDGVGLC